MGENVCRISESYAGAPPCPGDGETHEAFRRSRGIGPFCVGPPQDNIKLQGVLANREPTARYLANWRHANSAILVGRSGGFLFWGEKGDGVAAAGHPIRSWRPQNEKTTPDMV